MSVFYTQQSEQILESTGDRESDFGSLAGNADSVEVMEYLENPRFYIYVSKDNFRIYQTRKSQF